MILEDLIGQTFQENQLYEILHFDIEENLENYFSKFIHIYFDQLEAGRIRITEVVYFPDEDSLFVVKRKINKVRGWIDIYHQVDHISLMICRQDGSGKFSVIGPDINHVQTFKGMYYGTKTKTEPLTPEELRKGFAELAGVLEEHIKTSKPKIAV